MPQFYEYELSKQIFDKGIVVHPELTKRAKKLGKS
jgi:hypothetical protein